jgi:hypothetical protein
MQVWAKNEEMQKILVHPVAGGFGPDLATPADWPDDQFTTRRLKDGDILLQAPGTQQVKAKAPQAESTKI